MIPLGEFPELPPDVIQELHQQMLNKWQNAPENEYLGLFEGWRNSVD